jgi:hypothetical protein
MGLAEDTEAFSRARMASDFDHPYPLQGDERRGP